jgi:hypothetical protein
MYHVQKGEYRLVSCKASSMALCRVPTNEFAILQMILQI